MHHIGNDIVAYKHRRCIGKWRDAHFLSKILSDSEIAQLELQINKDAYLWMLWTLKEAAYKLSCFLGNRDKFHAKEFEVTADIILKDDDVKTFSAYPIHVHQENKFILTRVAYNGAGYFGKSLITNECVHSHVYKEEAGFICAIAVHSNYNKNDFSTEVRSFTKDYLAKEKIIFDVIEKDKDGIPFVTINNIQQYISLSHDQQFVSFAYAQ